MRLSLGAVSFIFLVMKKEVLILITLFIICSIKGQKSFSYNYEAKYKLSYKLRNTPTAVSEETTFILMMNEKESYFKSMNVHVGDSLKYYKKLKETGNVVKDLKTFSNYFSDFPENIGITRGKVYVTMPLATLNVGYQESNNFDWKILDEYKQIGNLKCTKAEINKFGRIWTAYFAEDIPLNYGPYKFNSLPGLIIELYDEKKDFHYELYKFKKVKNKCNFANSYKNIKETTKDKVFNYRKNSFLNISRFNGVIDDPESLKKIQERAKEMYNSYNPIELEID